MTERRASGIRGGVLQLALACLLLVGACAAGCSTSNAASSPHGIVKGAFAIPSPDSAPAVAPAPAYPPASWMAKIQPPMSGSAISIGCLDRNADGRVNSADAPELQAVDIALVRGDACLLLGQRREWFVADADLPLTCAAAVPAPLLIVAIAGGGTQLLDRDEGVSVGLIDIVNGVRAQAAAPGVTSGVILMTSAIESADLPQTRMEQWLAADLERRLGATRCLRVVLIGHSHGAVVVTSVMAALEDRYGGRMYGVLLDRSLLYYDRLAMELPQRPALLNVIQRNEGWHGEPIDAPNAINIDASVEVAPREPRDGLLPIVPVAHSTLDDAIGVQRQVVNAIGAWLHAGDGAHAP